MRRPFTAAAAIVTLVLAASGAVAAAESTPAARPAAPGTFTSHLLLDGARLHHQATRGREALSDPDDITRLHGDLFVGFQNGVGPQGQASPTGNLDSTLVEVTPAGHVTRQWDIAGKCDGLTADPATGRVIATVNEDARSSLYLVDPAARAPVHYRYDEALPSRGGTDAISVDHGRILVSASAPGTTGGTAPSARFPAVYAVALHAATHVADVHALFGDEASATVMNSGSGHGAHVQLALTDPDSNEVVPAGAHRFAGDFMLTSQGDKEQIYVSGLGTARRRLWVLRLSDSVDDTVWASGAGGAIVAVDTSQDRVERVTGPFVAGDSYVADTPCDAAGAPTTCPGPGFSANYLGALNPDTGQITRLDIHGPAVEPQGMHFIP